MARTRRYSVFKTLSLLRANELKLRVKVYIQNKLIGCDFKFKQILKVFFKSYIQERTFFFIRLVH